MKVKPNNLKRVQVSADALDLHLRSNCAFRAVWSGSGMGLGWPVGGGGDFEDFDEIIKSPEEPNNTPVGKVLQTGVKL